MINKGTRQGGLSSPFLFNLMYQDIVNELSEMNVGISINNTTYNTFCYADDLLLCSLTISGLQKLIDRAPRTGPTNRAHEQGPRTGPTNRAHEQGPRTGPTKQGPRTGPTNRAHEQGPRTGPTNRTHEQGPRTGPTNRAHEQIRAHEQGPRTGPTNRAHEQAPRTGPTNRAHEQDPRTGPTNRAHEQDPRTGPTNRSGPTNRAHEQIIRCRLNFNPFKTQCITFDKSVFNRRSWNLNNIALCETDSIRYKGGSRGLS